jgi:hypothetical protein
LSLGLVKEAQDAEFVMSDLISGSGDKESKKRKSAVSSHAENESARIKFEHYVETVLSNCK